MAAERLDGAIGIDLQKRIIVISARPRGLIVREPVEVAVPIASLKAVLAQVLVAEAQAEDGRAVVPLDAKAAAQNGIVPNPAISRNNPART